ncbi:unnamed protein product, partial [Symbiodinium sp. CCMP2456]
LWCHLFRRSHTLTVGWQTAQRMSLVLAQIQTTKKIAWLQPTFRPNPDIDALNDSGDIKFKSIDVKLGVAMTAMIKNGGDGAQDLYLNVNRSANKLMHDHAKLLKGRQIIAMMYESFRARDRLDMIVSLDYLIRLQYQGDQKMNTFKQTWLEIIDRVRPEDVPSETALTDTLYSKIKDSPALKQELCVRYDMLNYDDPNRSYQKLLHIVERCIRRNRENRNQQQIRGGKGNGNTSGKKGNKTDNENAAPVLLQTKAKAHSKAKAKGKPDKNKQRERSESTDGKPNLKHIKCRFFFSEHSECKGIDARTVTRRRRLSEDEVQLLVEDEQQEAVCYNFKKSGTCSRDNCPYAHINPATPAETEEKPEAKAKAKAKPKPEAKAEAKEKAKAKGKPKTAAPAIRMCRAWNPLAPAVRKKVCVEDDEESECSSIDSDIDSDCSTDDERDGTTWSTKPKVEKRVSFAADVTFQSSRPRKSKKDRGEKIVKVNMKKFIESENRPNEIGFAMHKPRLRAQLMYDMLADDKPGDRQVYVRIPGTDEATQIIFFDGEDEIVEMDVNSKKSKGLKVFDEVTRMVQPTWVRSKIKFLMDTGCGHDLISQRKVEKHGLETLVSPESGVSFQTANGVAATDLMSNFQTKSFAETINAYVLDDTPSVLSVGKRCMQQGYGFVWPPGKDPFMINPEGKRISLFVHGDIPYIRAGSQKSGPCEDEVASNIKSIFDGIGESGLLSSTAVDAAPATASSGADADGPQEEELEGPPDDEISADEAPDEEVPVAEAGRPPEPPDGEREDGAEDEREIEVEGEGEPTRKAKIGTLKAEAKTLAHLCAHRYRNPYCEACIRAKMKHYRTERGAFKRELKSWGDLITFDFLDMRKAADMGVGNDDEDREILVVRDVATKVIAAIPTKTRFTDDVVDALRRLIGRRKVKLAYSDAAPEFDAAMVQLRITVDHSLPGHPKNNSLAERTNQVVINAVATALLHAGLPAQYWPYALNCVTHNLNIEGVEGDGDSAWKRRTGEDFKGKPYRLVPKFSSSRHLQGRT